MKHALPPPPPPPPLLPLLLTGLVEGAGVELAPQSSAIPFTTSTHTSFEKLLSTPTVL